MNCNPNELAMVVSIPDNRCLPELGKIVTTKYLVKSYDGVDCWMIDPPIWNPILGSHCKAIADRDLRPIRPNPKLIEETSNERPITADSSI